jgi:hypothetical protein
MSSEVPDVRIPDGYDLKKIVEKMLYKLWMSNIGSLDKTGIEEIIEAGRK